MNASLLAAAALILTLGAVHSGLGERFVLGRLDRESLPRTFLGNGSATLDLLVASWHLLTVVWMVLAAALVWAASAPLDPRSQAAAQLVATVFACMSGAIVFFCLGRKPIMLVKHPAWLAFAGVAALIWTSGV